MAGGRVGMRAHADERAGRSRGTARGRGGRHGRAQDQEAQDEGRGQQDRHSRGDGRGGARGAPRRKGRGLRGVHHQVPV